MSSSIGLSDVLIKYNPVSLTSNRIVKRLFGKVTGLIGRVEDLIVEDREVERKTEADGMSRSKIGGSDLGGCFVGLQ